MEADESKELIEAIEMERFIPSSSIDRQGLVRLSPSMLWNSSAHCVSGVIVIVMSGHEDTELRMNNRY